MKNCSIILRLSFRERPALYMASFRHALLEDELKTVRGNTTGASGCSGTFQWTAAVQALCILLLKTAAWGARNKVGQQPTLQGESASPASSLSYALNRQSLWLQDMFGLEQNGELIARRLITGSNLARRRGGPTWLAINESLLDATSIRVYLGEQLVEDAQLLDLLGESIEELWSSKKPAKKNRQAFVLSAGRALELKDKQAPKPLPAPFDDPLWWNKLREQVLLEAHEALSDTNIFRPQAMQRSFSSLHQHPLFVKVAGNNVNLLSDVDRQLNARCRLGLTQERGWFEKHLMRDEPLRIAASAGSMATIAIVKYLREVKGYNIEINNRFLISQDIVQQLKAGVIPETIHGLVLAVGCATRLLQQKSPYRPFLTMPKCSHRLMRSKRWDNSRLSSEHCDFLFMTNELSSSSFYYSDLSRSGVLKSLNAHVYYVDPDEIISRLTEGNRELQTILWWPYCMFNELFDTAEPVAGFQNKWIYEAMHLFVHRALLEDEDRSRCLDVAIRNAWLALQTTPELLKAMIEPMLKDSDYVTFVYRANGLHNVQLQELPKPATAHRITTDPAVRTLLTKLHPENLSS